MTTTPQPDADLEEILEPFAMFMRGGFGDGFQTTEDKLLAWADRRTAAVLEQILSDSKLVQFRCCDVHKKVVGRLAALRPKEETK